MFGTALSYIAIAMLSMPAADTSPTIWIKDAPSNRSTPPMWVCKTLQQEAISLEILDRREVINILAKPGEFVNDLNILRRRYADLKDAPPLIVSSQYPDKDFCRNLLAFNREYLAFLNNTRWLAPSSLWEDYREAEAETNLLYTIWDAVRDSKCDFYYITARRSALKKLRDEYLGPGAFYAGWLPPPVPVWRFSLS